MTIYSHGMHLLWIKNGSYEFTTSEKIKPRLATSALPYLWRRLHITGAGHLRWCLCCQA